MVERNKSPVHFCHRAYRFLFTVIISPVASKFGSMHSAAELTSVFSLLSVESMGDQVWCLHEAWVCKAPFPLNHYMCTAWDLDGSVTTCSVLFCSVLFFFFINFFFSFFFFLVFVQ